MPEPVYDVRTGKQVAVAFWPEELPEPPEPKRRPKTKVKVFAQQPLEEVK